MVFAGAGISLFELKDGALREIPGVRQNLGHRGRRPRRDYVNHVLEHAAGARYYATTDGFLDEGGGERGFGFGTQRFREMLLDHAATPMREQAGLFKQALKAYRGSRKQRDDVTLVGFRL